MCYDDNARPPLPPGATGKAAGNDVELIASDGNLFAAYDAHPDGAPARAQVLIMPDIRGLHHFYKELALRFAESGIAAIAVDYFGRTAGIGSRDESFQWQPHVEAITFPGIVADAHAALKHVAGTGKALPAFTVGFCIGGTLSFLAGTSDLPLAGVIGFYSGVKRSITGAGTLLERAADVKHPALGLFGGDDGGIPPEAVAGISAAFERAKIAHTVITYPSAPHGFFDRRATDFAEASADAWQQVLGFIQAHA